MIKQPLDRRYTGQTAESYDRNRSKTKKWRKEQVAVEEYLGQLKSGTSILDIPVGTGRFIHTYDSMQFSAVGVDISADMLKHAREKLTGSGNNIDLRLGSAFNIPFENSSFDCVLSVRFLNWLSIRDVELVIKELSRVTKHNVIISVRTGAPFAKAVLSPIKTARRIRNRFFLSNRLFIHSERKILKIIQQSSLRVSERKIVDSGNDGTVFWFMKLEKI